MKYVWLVCKDHVYSHILFSHIIKIGKKDKIIFNTFLFYNILDNLETNAIYNIINYLFNLIKY